MHRAAKPMHNEAPKPKNHTFDGDEDELDKMRQRRSSMLGYAL
jgi:hypothetical protein